MVSKTKTKTKTKTTTSFLLPATEYTIKELRASPKTFKQKMINANWFAVMPKDDDNAISLGWNITHLVTHFDKKYRLLKLEEAFTLDDAIFTHLKYLDKQNPEVNDE